jgi:carboxypeptidase PM20D1
MVHGRSRVAVWLGTTGIAVALLGGVLLWRAFAPAASVVAAAPQVPAVALQPAAERLAGALRFQTVSHADALDSGAAALEELHAHLERSFPLVHANLQRERVGGHSLLYTWRGRDAQAAAVLLMAHLDVVPVAPGTEGRWTHPPFGGVVADGFVWGRGAWDDKSRVMAQLEAVESLLRHGLQPARTVYLAFGHDEELGGARGAQAIAALLLARGAKLHYVLDEGLVVSDGVIPGARRPVALIGVAEKGRVTVRLRASATPGHASTPPRDSAIGRLSRAIAALEAQPMPARLQGVAAEMFGTLAPEMGPGRRVLLANLWLFGPLVQRALEQTSVTNAMVRTTTAVTVVRGGLAPNALPGMAEAMVNFRLLPGDSADDVLDHVRRVARADGVEAALMPAAQPPSGVSPHDTDGYRAIRQSVNDAFGDVAVAPGLVVGGTDARHMSGLTDRVYRFSPVRVRPDDVSRIHGDNERLAIDNYAEMIRFFQCLLLRSAADAVTG